MEDRGFFSDELITSTVRGMSKPERRRLHTDFNQLLRGEQKASRVGIAEGTFNFLASSSFRGERCCSYPDCRMKKAPQLLEFAALYADRLHLPFDTGFPGDEGYRLEGSLRMAHCTRRLIDSDIIRPSLGTLELCTQCAGKLTGVGTQLEATAIDLQKTHVSKFQVTARMRTRRKKRVLVGKVTGPSEYMETSPMFYEFADFPARAQVFVEETVLSPDEILAFRILDRVFFPSIKDFVSQYSFSKSANATYLSDLPGETEFFRSVRGQTETEEWQMSVLRNLNHEIPIFSGLPIERLIGLRNDEEFAFRNYRNAVSKAIRMSPSGGDPQRIAKEIWEQQIRPEVERLESKAHEIQKSFRKALISRAVPTSMILGVGLLGSAISPGLAHAIDIAASCSLVKDMLPSRRGSVEDQLASEDFYFLLRASEQ